MHKGFKKIESNKLSLSKDKLILQYIYKSLIPKCSEFLSRNYQLKDLNILVINMEATVRATRIYTMMDVINKSEDEILLKIEFETSVDVECKNLDKNFSWVYIPKEDKLMLSDWDIRWLDNEFKFKEKIKINTTDGIQLSNIIEIQNEINFERYKHEVNRDEVLRVIENMLSDSKMYRLNKIQKEDTMEYLRTAYDDHQWKSLEQAVTLVFKSM